MNQFSLDRAWSLGIGFFGPKAAGHAIILIGIGVLVPTAAQLALTGGLTGSFNPATSLQNYQQGAATGAAQGIVAILNMVFQLGSYFASWRLGFAYNQTLGGAIGYGLAIGALILLAGFMLLLLLAAIAAASPGLMGIAAAILLFPLLAALFTIVAAAIAVATALSLLLVTIFGAGSMLAGTQFRWGFEGPLALLLGFLLCILMLWLTARLSCVAPAMADRRGFNPIAGIAESWRRTAEGQWRIFAYLVLLGLVLCVIFFVLAVTVGITVGTSLQAEEDMTAGIGQMLFGAVLGIAFAYLTVLVPAGIYRAVGGQDQSEVFA